MQILASEVLGFTCENLFKDLNNEDHILIAVSGGSDSVALLYLLHEWAQAVDGPKLSVATIDHGLRAESAKEAEQVGLIAKKLGLRQVIEHWSGEKPDSALSQKAREVRYALLSKIAHDIGAGVIALGHNLDDQRETVLMRAKRVGFSDFASEPDERTNLGLAGMQSSISYCGPPYFKPVGLARPLLSVTREKLRLVLQGLGESWADDPSNEDDHYERVRLRKTLLAHPEKYPSADAIGEFAAKTAACREVLLKKASQFVTDHVCWHRLNGVVDGVVNIDRAAFCNAAEPEMRYLLRALIGVVGGRNFLVSPDIAARLITSISDGSAKRQSLGSVIIDPQEPNIRLWRENRNLPILRIKAVAGSTFEWDGRIIYRFSDGQSRQALELRALGKDGVEFIEEALGRKLKSASGEAIYTQPAIFKAGEPVFAPVLPWCAEEFAAPEVEFRAPALEYFRPKSDRALGEVISQLRYPANYCGGLRKA